MYNELDNTMSYQNDMDMEDNCSQQLYQKNMNDNHSISSLYSGKYGHYSHHFSPSDKGHFQVCRSKKHRGQYAIDIYETSYIPETRIRNAVTGNRYRDEHPKLKYLVGSAQEDLFFKVSFSTGERGRNPSILFYDSPEQCEKHHKIVLSQKIKEAWNAKVLKARHRMSRASE